MTMLDARKSTDGQRPPVTARSRRNPTVAAAVAGASAGKGVVSVVESEEEY